MNVTCWHEYTEFKIKREENLAFCIKSHECKRRWTTRTLQIKLRTDVCADVDCLISPRSVETFFDRQREYGDTCQFPMAGRSMWQTEYGHISWSFKNVCSECSGILEASEFFNSLLVLSQWKGWIALRERTRDYICIMHVWLSQCVVVGIGPLLLDRQTCNWGNGSEFSETCCWYIEH
jgi:hypothetical protein